MSAPESSPGDASLPKTASGTPLTADLSLLELEKALEGALETLSTLASSTRRFTYDSQDLIYKKVNEFVGDLQTIDEKAKGVTATIPLEVIEAIDKGRNPQLVTYQMLESCAEADYAARGKLKAMEELRDAFDEELKHDDTTADDINAETGAEKKDVVMADPADGR